MDTKHDSAEVTRKIAEVRQHVEELKRKVDADRMQATRKEPELRSLIASITTAELAIQRIENDLKLKEKNLEDNKKKEVTLEKEVEEARKQYTEHKRELDSVQREMQSLSR